MGPSRPSPWPPGTLIRNQVLTRGPVLANLKLWKSYKVLITSTALPLLPLHPIHLDLLTQSMSCETHHSAPASSHCHGVSFAIIISCLSDLVGTRRSGRPLANLLAAQSQDLPHKWHLSKTLPRSIHNFFPSMLQLSRSYKTRSKVIADFDKKKSNRAEKDLLIYSVFSFGEILSFATIKTSSRRLFYSKRSCATNSMWDTYSRKLG